MRAISAVLFAFCAGASNGGSRWEETVVILASEPNTVGDYRDDIASFRSFEAQRERIRERWVGSCLALPSLDVTLSVVASKIELIATGSIGFQANYWVVILSSDGRAEDLLDLARTCSRDAYLRNIVIWEPLRHPVCNKACESNAELYMEYCAVTDFQIILPERGVNPFENCNISGSEYEDWLGRHIENWQF